MVAQSPPYALQNAAHSAQLFRQATFSAWRSQSGIVGPTDFTVAAQSTPNMSIQVAAGRAWMQGTQVAVVSGGNWSPQAGYFGINDAPVSLSVAAADPTNPRIDSVGAWVLDSFYSGASNLLVIGIVTGTPSASPVAPTLPNNAVALATYAVSANATSIVSGNISNFAGNMVVTRGGIRPATLTDTTPGQYTGEYRDIPIKGLQRWDGIFWNSPVPALGKRVVKTGTQTITAAWQVLTWDQADTALDPGTSGMFTAGGSTLTAPLKGIYAVTCGVENLTNIQIRHNAGGSVAGGDQVTSSNGGTSGPTTAYNNAAASGFLMNAGDTLQVFGYNTTSQSAGTASGYTAFFSLTLIATLP